MNGFGKLPRRFRWPWRSGEEIRAEVDEEIAFHLDMRAEELMREGLGPNEAGEEARRQFGNVEAVRRSLRKADEGGERSRRRAEWIGDVVQDVRYAVRALRRSPGFAAVAVLTLALGIGANSAIFSVVHAVLLRPLPYDAPERLVRLWETTPRGVDDNVVSSGNYLDWREGARSFEELGAHSGWFGMGLTGAGEPVRVLMARITPAALRVLGVDAALGRTFTEAEGDTGGPPVVLISNALWRQRFGAQPDIIGRTLTLNDNPMTVVGVMPAGFDFPSPDVQALLPLRFDAEDRENRESHSLNVIGRLAPGATVEEAEAEMNVLAASIAEDHPEHMTGWGVNVVPFRTDLVADVRPLLLVLLGVVGVVLLVACANLANLLLARATARESELAVRAALGAGRGRLVRQLLSESALLALVGGALGMAVVAVALDGLVAFAPADIPLLDDVRVDPAVLGFAAAVTLLATLLFGLVPALRITRTDLQGPLRAAAGRGGMRHTRMREALLVGEVALSLVLLIAAGLLARSFVRLHDTEYGFDPDGLLTVMVDLPYSRYDTQARQIGFYEALIDRVRALPAVAAAAGTNEPPIVGYNNTFSFSIENRPASTPSGQEDDESIRIVTPGYFRTMGLPLLRGRVIDETDRRDAPPVVVINESLARKHWPAGDAVGQRISTQGPEEGPWFEIVGVVGDTRHYGLDQPTRPAIYMPLAQKPWGWMSWLTLVVRAAPGQDPTALLPTVRRAIWELDDGLPVQSAATVTDLYAESTARRRFAMQLLGAFAALALLLGTIGIYGVLSYSVEQRRREIGIRMALGAASAGVQGLVVRRALALAAIGIVFGLAAALAATRVLAGLLYGVSATDPATFLAVPLVLLAVSLLAGWLPARRAARVDPMAALGSE